MTRHGITLALEQWLSPRAPAAAPATASRVCVNVRSGALFLPSAIALLTLGATATQLAALAGHDYVFGLVALLDLNGEHNLPSWFSSVQLLWAAALLAGLAASEPDRRWGWTGLSAVFVCLSIDEAASIHEMLNRPLRALLHAGPMLFFPWVIVGGAAVLAMAFVYGPFILTLREPVRSRALLSAVVFVTGAIGVEMVSAPFYARYGKGTLLNLALVTLEEVCEMAGVALFISALVARARERQAAVRIVFDDRASRQEGDRLVSPRKVQAVLSRAIVLLGVFSLGGQVVVQAFGHPDTWRVARLFNLARAGNLPTWYQSMSLLTCAGLLGTIAMVRRQGRDPLARTWQGLAFLFVLLSLDEAAAIHEMRPGPLRALPGAGWLLAHGGAWSGLLVVGGVGAACWRLLTALPREIRRTMLLAAALYVGGALGLDAFSGWWAGGRGREGLRLAVLVTAEESLEMIGVLVFLGALLMYLRDYVGPVTFRVALPRSSGGRTATNAR